MVEEETPIVSVKAIITIKAIVSVSEPIHAIGDPVCPVNAPIRKTVAVAELIPTIKVAITSVHESIMVMEPIEVVVSRRETLMIGKVVRTRETR